MQAVNLFFAVSGMETNEFGPFQVRDKIPLKKDLEKAGVRVVPPAASRASARTSSPARCSCPAS